LHLPEGAIVALVSRDGALIAPRGSTQLRAGDHLFVIARTSDRDAVNRVLGHDV
jgi:cell volume regulation protein A